MTAPPPSVRVNAALPESFRGGDQLDRGPMNFLLVSCAGIALS
jgi:hypothetical protein